MARETVLAIVILAVDNLSAMRTFYESVLSWKVEVDSPTYVELSGDDGVGLGLYESEGFMRNLGSAKVSAAPSFIRPLELYFRVQDLEDACQQATNAGALLLSPPAMRDWGEMVAYFADPEGNVLALASKRKAT